VRDRASPEATGARQRARQAVHRIRYPENKTNCCARCQTEGRLRADRSLSRLLKDDSPRSLDEL